MVVVVVVSAYWCMDVPPGVRRCPPLQPLPPQLPLHRLSFGGACRRVFSAHTKELFLRGAVQSWSKWKRKRGHGHTEMDDEYAPSSFVYSCGYLHVRVRVRVRVRARVRECACACVRVCVCVHKVCKKKIKEVGPDIHISV